MKNSNYIRRKADDILTEWKRNPHRKPLIVKGARQVGKTETILHFARQNYKNIIYINFVEDEKFKSIVKDGYAPENIIKNITLTEPSAKFVPKKTLIIFDELHFVSKLCDARNKRASKKFSCRQKYH